MSGYTRQQYAEMTKRVRIMVENKFLPGTKCIICGRRMSSPDCTHSLDENESAFEKIKGELRV